MAYVLGFAPASPAVPQWDHGTGSGSGGGVGVRVAAEGGGGGDVDGEGFGGVVVVAHSAAGCEYAQGGGQ